MEAYFTMPERKLVAFRCADYGGLWGRLGGGLGGGLGTAGMHADRGKDSDLRSWAVEGLLRVDLYGFGPLRG